MEKHVRDLLGLLARLNRGERLLGIDPGEKRIGLALSDVSLTIASPLETLGRRRFRENAMRLCEIVKQHGIGGFVVGMPLHMKGNAGAKAQSALSFAHRLGEAAGLPFVLWDERLSTLAVGHVLRDAGVGRRRRGELVDKLAAAHILQGALDCARTAEGLRPGPHDP